MSLQPEESCLAFFVEWMCYHWILLFFLHLQYLYPVIPQDYFWCIWNAGLTLLFFQNLKYIVWLHAQHFFYNKFPVIWIIVPIHVMCLFVGCCLQGFASLSLIYSVYKMYLRVVFFDFILLVFTHFLKSANFSFGKWSATIFKNIFSAPISFSSSFETSMTKALYIWILCQ